MRLSLCVLAWSLCTVAAAQTTESPPAPTDSVAALQTPDAPTRDATATPDAAATPVKGTLYMCKYVADSGLYTINPINGAAKLVGSMDLNQTCTDLAFRKTAASGTQLYGTSFTRLYKINFATGKAVLLPQAYGGTITDINALVAQPLSGIMYGMGSRAPGEFVVINPTTGVATKKGSLGTGIGSAGDLEFLNGQLYGLVTKAGYGNETFLAKISLTPATMGKATDLLLIRRKEGNSLVALSNVWGLANRNGVLYATMETGEVLTISPTNGIATLKGDYKLPQAGLAVAP